MRPERKTLAAATTRYHTPWVRKLLDAAASTRGMDIREATTADAETVAREFWHPLAEQMEQYSDLNALQEDAADDAVAGFESLIGDDEAVRVFLLDVDDEPIACIVVESGTHPSRVHDTYLSINDLHVREGHRGQGHGTALVEHAEALAARENCDFLKVSAEWGNEPAREFYDGHDYEPKHVTYTKRVE